VVFAEGGAGGGGGGGLGGLGGGGGGGGGGTDHEVMFDFKVHIIKIVS